MKLLALLLISMQLAAEPVEDIHQQIEQYIGHREFAESFQTGDVYQITLAEDLRGIKSENHFKLDVTVNGSAARIGSSTVTAQEWAAWHGNFGRSITNFAQEMGIKLEMRVLDLVEARVMVNGRPARLGGIKVEYYGANALGTPFKGELVLTGSLPGQAQIVYRREVHAGITRTWTLTHFSRVSGGSGTNR